MTKEQEVIKYIETRIKICNENADICDDNDFDEEATYLREESYMLETILSMLKQKDKEIEHQKEKRNNQKAELAILNEKQKEMNKLINTVSSYKGMVRKEQKDNKRKDKINKLLIDFIYKMSIIRPETIMYDLKEDGFDTSECGYCKDKFCKNCIKQYFERKSEK